MGLAANGFIDILNGPMDNGWCGGYTCQERISTFFGIVAAGLSYTMALTSTNPQNMALHLLNAEDSQSIVIAIYYTNPQRLDVYSGGEYVVPNNAMMLENGNLEYQTGTVEDFTPTLLQSHGSNYYDRDRKLLHILVKGDRQYEIRTTPVIQVGMFIPLSFPTLITYFLYAFQVRTHLVITIVIFPLEVGSHHTKPQNDSLSLPPL